MKRPKRPRDPSQLAKLIVDIATGEVVDDSKDETARAKVGRLGGLKGGIARAVALPQKRRQEIARTAARKRWKKATEPA